MTNRVCCVFRFVCLFHFSSSSNGSYATKRQVSLVRLRLALVLRTAAAAVATQMRRRPWSAARRPLPAALLLLLPPSPVARVPCRVLRRHFLAPPLVHLLVLVRPAAAAAAAARASVARSRRSRRRAPRPPDSSPATPAHLFCLPNCVMSTKAQKHKSHKNPKTNERTKMPQQERRDRQPHVGHAVARQNKQRVGQMSHEKHARPGGGSRVLVGGQERRTNLDVNLRERNTHE